MMTSLLSLLTLQQQTSQTLSAYVTKPSCTFRHRLLNRSTYYYWTLSVHLMYNCGMNFPEGIISLCSWELFCALAYMITVPVDCEKGISGVKMWWFSEVAVCSQHPNTSRTLWCGFPISTWTPCSHLMELMWMDFSLYLCHLTCINSHPYVFPSLSLSQSHLHQCVYVHVCVSAVEMECRLAPGCLHGSTPPILHPLGKRKRKGGREKKRHTCTRESLLLPILVFL